jgi:predicted nucleotidyltransferase
MVRDELAAKVVPRLRAELVALYGARLVKILLYGSRARGDADRWSDVDVAVVLAGTVDRIREIRRTSALISSLSLEFETVVHCKFLDVDSLNERDTPLANSLLDDGVPV